MDIDTLILSGGSTKGISFLGSFNYLIDILPEVWYALS